MFLKKILMASAVSAIASGASAECAFENTVPLKSLTAGFEAWTGTKAPLEVMIRALGG